MHGNLTGDHLIAGKWHASQKRFSSLGLDGVEFSVSSGGADEVDRAARAAEDAFKVYSSTSRAQRAAFLDKIADCIEACGEAISIAGTAETGLPAARLTGERGRTTGQLRLFADHIRSGDYLDRRHTPALPDRQPAPRPDLRLVQRPVGPVGVFGASNFPLAFSTAGGDTAAALAAGCSVVVKAHPAHPRTGELVARAISEAINSCGMPAGLFNLVQGNTHEVGEALVCHPLIRAAAFTGSLHAGRSLFNLSVARPEPIPFFGEFGSINPVFVLPGALRERSTQIATGWTASLTLGAGQFCTNPGVIFVTESEGFDAFRDAAVTTLAAATSQTMLTESIASSYRKGCEHLQQSAGVETLVSVAADGRFGGPSLFITSLDAWLSNPDLAEEVFGPSGIIVVVPDANAFGPSASALAGQLTATVHMSPSDQEIAEALLPRLERIVGRILFNGYPTGVEVADAMVHSGPYPATTNFGATSVGTMSIRRFLRPVCYQDMPESLLRGDLLFPD